MEPCCNKYINVNCDYVLGKTAQAMSQLHVGNAVWVTHCAYKSKGCVNTIQLAIFMAQTAHDNAGENKLA